MAGRLPFPFAEGDRVLFLADRYEQWLRTNPSARGSSDAEHGAAAARREVALVRAPRHYGGGDWQSVGLRDPARVDTTDHAFFFYWDAGGYVPPLCAPCVLLLLL
jgi:hypothetical protein